MKLKELCKQHGANRKVVKAALKIMVDGNRFDGNLWLDLCEASPETEVLRLILIGSESVGEYDFSSNVIMEDDGNAHIGIILVTDTVSLLNMAYTYVEKKERKKRLDKCRKLMRGRW